MASYLICDIDTGKEVNITQLSKDLKKVLISDLTKIKELLEHYIETGEYPAVGVEKFNIKLLDEDEEITRFVAQDIVEQLDAEIKLLRKIVKGQVL